MIETDLGSYPMNSGAVISKGTPLVLEKRASGDGFICDANHNLCIKTSGQEFKQSADIPIAPKPLDPTLPLPGGTP